MGRLLIVDDEPNLRRVLSSDLRMDGHVVEEAEGVTRAVSETDFGAEKVEAHHSAEEESAPWNYKRRVLIQLL